MQAPPLPARPKVVKPKRKYIRKPKSVKTLISIFDAKIYENLKKKHIPPEVFTFSDKDIRTSKSMKKDKK